MHRPSPFFPPTASVRCPSIPSPLPPAPCPLPQPVTFPATRPFCAIYQPRPARSLVPPRSRCIAAVLQFQPHFCASLSRPANTINRATLSGTGAYRCALFFQATQAFSQESTRATLVSRKKKNRDLCRNSVPPLFPSKPLPVFRFKLLAKPAPTRCSWNGFSIAIGIVLAAEIA